MQAEVERLTGVRIFDVHIGDAKNLSHPSFFDSTDTYEIVVFRGLSPESTVDEIVTRPMTFFNFDRLLVTVRAADSRSVAQVKSRFVNLPGKIAAEPRRPDAAAALGDGRPLPRASPAAGAAARRLAARSCSIRGSLSATG